MKSKKKLLNFVLIWVLMIFLIIGYYLMAFCPIWNSFYRACHKIEIGYTRAQVRSVMQYYMSNDKYTYNSSAKGEYFYDHNGGMMDDYQCNILIDDDRVRQIIPIFD